MNIRMLLSTAALLTLLAAGPVYPQKDRDIILLSKDMLELQTRMKQLQTTVDQDNAVMKGLMEKMADQVNTLTGGLQRITQAIDGIKTQNDATAREFRTALTTLNGTVKEMEQDLSSARNQINSIKQEITTLKTTSEPLAKPDDLWRNAHSDFSAGNWDLAVSGLQEFLSKYPDDPRAAEAHIKMGDSLTAQKKYDAAVAEYDFVLQKFPESDKSRAALLKKGLAQAEATQPQATNTLNEVVKKYPGTIEAQAATARLKELQAAQRRPPAR